MEGKLTEIFESIQGEGIYQGMRQVFLRCYGCNLRCQFCDTKLDSYKEYEAKGLIREIGSLNGRIHSIALTGGEPLLQLDFLKEFLPLAWQMGSKIYLETNGTLPDSLSEVIDNIDIIAMDFKFPSSTGLRDFWCEHEAFLRIALQKEVFVKAVICNSTNLADLEKAVRLLSNHNKNITFILQPNSFELNGLLSNKIKEFQKFALEFLSDVRVIPQMHKLMRIR